MLRFEKQALEAGYILLTTLIILFVLSLLVAESLENISLNEKLLGTYAQADAVYAESIIALHTLVIQFQKVQSTLSKSISSQKAEAQLVSVDPCGNKTVDFTVSAENAFTQICLKRRDIFARVPRLPHCKPLALDTMLWQAECAKQ